MLIVGLIVGTGVAVRAQERSPRFRSDVNLVTLDVCVKDPAGRVVGGLTPDDFVVLENGVPQRLSFFAAAEPLPINAVLLLDRSASMAGGKLDQARAAAVQFARRLQPRDRVRVVAFNERAMVVGRGAPAADAWAPALEALAPSGSTALYDALMVAAHELKKARAERRDEQTRDVIIVLSDGEDTSSVIGFDEVLPLLRRSGALVYGLSLRTGENGSRLGASWPLLKLAKDTGARAVGVPRLDALAELYAQIDAEVRHLYRLGYVSTNPRADGEWRHVRVGLTTSGATARTRAGYYAPRAQIPNP